MFIGASQNSKHSQVESEPMPDSMSDDDVQQIMAAVFAGKKILAIKLYRQATKASLLDAKNFVEALEDRLWQESPEKFTTPPSKSGCARSATVLLSLGISIYFGVRHLLS
jgi:hypothetical protein